MKEDKRKIVCLSDQERVIRSQAENQFSYEASMSLVMNAFWRLLELVSFGNFLSYWLWRMFYFILRHFERIEFFFYE